LDEHHHQWLILESLPLQEAQPPAEADAAAAKVSELTQEETRAAAHLQRLGWGEVQAAGTVAGLDRFPPC